MPEAIRTGELEFHWYPDEEGEFYYPLILQWTYWPSEPRTRDYPGMPEGLEVDFVRCTLDGIGAGWIERTFLYLYETDKDLRATVDRRCWIAAFPHLERIDV